MPVLVFFGDDMMEYTAEMLYDAALALLSEEKQRVKDYPKFKIALTNQVVAECFSINNVLRELDGFTAFNKEEMPMVETSEDVIPYDIRLLRECMPYGLAALLVMDDDKEKCAVFSNQFELLKSKYSRAQAKDIINNY